MGFEALHRSCIVKYQCKLEGALAQRIRVPNSSSGASVQQSVGSNPGCDTYVPEHGNYNCFSPSRGK